MSFKTNLVKLTNTIKRSMPTIAVVSGVISMGTAVVLGCVTTAKKLPKANEDTLNDIDEVHSIKDNVTPAEYRKELTKTYSKIAWRYIRLYGLTVILSTTGAILVMKGHKAIKIANASLIATCKSYEEIMKRVKKEIKDTYGEEEAKRIFSGVETVKVTKSDNDNSVEKEVISIGANDGDLYNWWFDERFTQHRRDEVYNGGYLNSIQIIFDEKLKRNGVVFLNEVLDALGYIDPKTGLSIIPEGQNVGWIYSKEESVGDNYIDFNLTQSYKRNSDGTVDTTSKYWHISFNCDGFILDRLDEI